MGTYGYMCVHRSLTCPPGYGGSVAHNLRCFSCVQILKEQESAMAIIASAHPPYLFVTDDGVTITYPYTGEEYVEYDFLAYGQDENAENAYSQYIRETYK